MSSKREVAASSLIRTVSGRLILGGADCRAKLSQQLQSNEAMYGYGAEGIPLDESCEIVHAGHCDKKLQVAAGVRW